MKIDTILVMFFMVLVCLAPLAFGEEGEGEKSGEILIPARPLINVFTNDALPDLPPIDAFSPVLGYGYYPWGTFSAQKVAGNHEFTINGATMGYHEPLLFGYSDPMWAFGSSVTWRYKGLFNGIVRPVARFSLGTGEAWDSPGGSSFHGYTPGLSSYAVGEAGVEFVYKGYGVGVTAGYKRQMDTDMELRMRDDELTGGPFAPRTGPASFEDWIWSIYPIIE